MVKYVVFSKTRLDKNCWEMKKKKKKKKKEMFDNINLA